MLSWRQCEDLLTRRPPQAFVDSGYLAPTEDTVKTARGFQKVRYSAQEVAIFSRSWPCSGLALAPITFEFEVNQNGTLGDLVDIDRVRTSSDSEETERALAAMAEDAKQGCCGRWL